MMPSVLLTGDIASTLNLVLVWPGSRVRASGSLMDWLELERDNCRWAAPVGSVTVTRHILLTLPDPQEIDRICAAPVDCV
jgi:hypothetical protein